jgi:hypothetical protein
MFKVIFLIYLLMFFSCGRGDEPKGSKGNPTTPSPLPPVTPKPSPPSIPQIPGGNIAEAQQFISFHKLKRCWHNVPNLRWNDNIASSARDHAKKCTFMKDEKNTVWGESIAFEKGSGIIALQDKWYMQFLQFPFGNKNGNGYTREFTQMVWKSSTDFGCASVYCGEINYVVCRYSPAGNVPDQYAENVYPLKADISQCGLF